MIRRFLFTFVFAFLCVPCFAEELPSVPELIKRMYDYRMAIENMRAEVTVTKPVNTNQPHVEKMKRHFYFAYDKGRVRCDTTYYGVEPSDKWLYQYLSTPDFYFIRHPSEVPEINDGNSLFLNDPLTQPFDTFDPRRIGTDWSSFDTIEIVHFNYDSLLECFYSPHGENYNVSVDVVDGEKLYKVSFHANNGEIVNSYWINPQKGYNFVKGKSESEKFDMSINHTVTLGKFNTRLGKVWFPQTIVHKNKVKNDILEEMVVVDTIAFDVQDVMPFTLPGLGIPVGYRVEYFSEGARTWDGKELVKKIPYEIEPVSMKSRRVFWIVNAAIFAFLAFWILVRWLRRKSHG